MLSVSKPSPPLPCPSLNFYPINNKEKDSFCLLYLSGLEINERPAKKAMLDFSSLSISEPSSSSAGAQGTAPKQIATFDTCQNDSATVHRHYRYRCYVTKLSSYRPRKI
jgi:hypothetical protein